MDYIILLANRNLRGCPLVIQKKSSFDWIVGPWNGPHWILLKSNLFQASVDAIDTLLWLTGEAQKRAGRELVSTAEPFRGVKAMPESSGPTPTVEQMTELVGAIGRFAFDDEGLRTRLFGGKRKSDSGFLRLLTRLRPLSEPDWKAEGWPEWVSGWLPDVVGRGCRDIRGNSSMLGLGRIAQASLPTGGLYRRLQPTFPRILSRADPKAAIESAKLFDPVTRPAWIEELCVTVPSIDFDSLSFDFADDPRLNPIRQAVHRKRLAPRWGSGFPTLFRRGAASRSTNSPWSPWESD